MKGNILKIKAGYNPNSSSIGSEIRAFIYGTALFTILANCLIAIVTVFRSRSEKDNIPAENDENGTKDVKG